MHGVFLLLNGTCFRAKSIMTRLGSLCCALLLLTNFHTNRRQQPFSVKLGNYSLGYMYFTCCTYPARLPTTSTERQVSTLFLCCYLTRFPFYCVRTHARPPGAGNHARRCQLPRARLQVGGREPDRVRPRQGRLRLGCRRVRARARAHLPHVCSFESFRVWVGERETAVQYINCRRLF